MSGSLENSICFLRWREQGESDLTKTDQVIQDLGCGRDSGWLRAEYQAGRIIATILVRLAAPGALTVQRNPLFALRMLSGQLYTQQGQS